jgi:serine/threonine protein kinase/Flp pilus assembly protein TadD
MFNELVVLDSGERHVRLASLQDTDPHLKKELELLLEADASADARLKRFELGVSDIVRTRATSMVDAGDPLKLAGTTVSHFRVLEFLAAGGMGVVYRAEDLQLHRIVALKFPLPHYQLDPSVRNRFLREARSAGSLEHPNLCTVFEAGESDAGVFLAMPLYSGETLKHRIARDKVLPINEAIGIAIQIASGLAFAHVNAVVHRDLKPGNIMLLPDGTAKILDFGLARTTDISNTKSGVTLGTVSYMSPEQVRGARADERSDLWSLGVVVFEMVYGVRPFTGDNEVSIAHAILHEQPKSPPSVRRDVSTPLKRTIASLLQKDPVLRYQNAAGLADDLEAVRRGASPSFQAPRLSRTVVWMKKRRTIGLIAGVALIAGFAATFGPRFVEALNKPTDNPEAYQFYLRGREYEVSGPMSAAESLYNRAIALDSGFALAHARLAIVYAECLPGGSRDCVRRNVTGSRVDKTEHIRTEAQRALTLNHNLADGHLAMGLYWEQKEQPRRALPELLLAKKGLDKSGELHAAIGRSYRQLGEWDRAIAELKRSIEIDPKDVTSMADLATTLSRLRRYRESVEYWDRHLALVPDDNEGRVIRGNVYLRWLGTVDTLAAVFRQLPPDFRSRAIATQVLIARLQNRPADALAALDKAPKRLPADPASYNSPPLTRAQVLSDMGDTKRARAYFDTARVQLEQVVAQKPDDFRRHIALGLAYAGVGRIVDAKRAADRALALMPSSQAVPAGTTAMRGAAEIFAQIPQYHRDAISLLDELMRMPAGREVSAAFLRVHPAWKPLRGEPAFQALLSKYPSP